MKGNLTLCLDKQMSFQSRFKQRKRVPNIDRKAISKLRVCTTNHRLGQPITRLLFTLTPATTPKFNSHCTDVHKMANVLASWNFDVFFALTSLQLFANSSAVAALRLVRGSYTHLTMVNQNIPFSTHGSPSNLLSGLSKI